MLKDCIITEDIGALAEDNLNAGLYIGSLANEVILSNDVDISFDAGAVIYLTKGGKITLNGHKLTLTTSSAGSGISYCQMHYVDDEIVTYTGNDGTATINEDLIFTKDPNFGFILQALIYESESKWTAKSGFDTAGYYLDVRTMSNDPTKVGEYTKTANATQELSVEAKDNATYIWTDNAFAGAEDIIIGFNEEPSSEDTTATIRVKQQMMTAATKYIYCDVFEANGNWQRYYWIITVPSNGPAIPMF